MNSFYGGKQGNSFIIAQTYSTIAEMVASFGKNNTACPVDFDEYVLINTVNKNNPENGQVFRRGYDYNSGRTITSYQHTYGKENPYEEIQVEANGAIYIGTIVGPAGRAPIFNFGQYNDVQNVTKINTKTFAEIGVSNPANSSRSSIIKTLNNLIQKKDDQIIFKTPSGESEVITDFYTLELINDNTRTIVHYYCYDRRYQLNHQNSIGWYSVDSAPATGVSSFNPADGLIAGVTYAYENGELLYDIDVDGKRHIRKGVNELGNTYQDTIDWAYCTVRNENLEDSTAYIGFRFGYPVVEFETESVSPYYKRSDIIDTKTGLPKENPTNSDKTNKFENLNLIERTQTQEEINAHPFYSKWKISIPKGIKGESIHNIRVITASDNVYQFKLDDQKNFVYNNIGEIQVEDYEGKADDIEYQRKIYVFDYVSYDRKPEGEWHTIYLGDFNTIDDVTFNEDGTVVVDYSHDNTYIKSKLIHWIDDMKFDDDGTVTITFNNDDLNTDQIKAGVLSKPHLFHWIDNMNFAEDGTVTVTFNNEDLNMGQIKNGEINLPHLFHWITDMNFAEDGTVSVDFNNSSLNPNNSQIKNGKIELPHLFHWITNVNFAKDGTFTITFNNEDLNIGQIKNGKMDLPNYIKWIENISLDENDGHFIVNFNYDNEPDTGVATQINQFLTWIKDVRIDEDGTVHWDYTTSEDSYKIDNYLKWIKDVRLDPETGFFEIDFNYNTAAKPTKVEKSLQWVKDISITDDGTITTDYTNKDNKVQTKLIKWLKSINLDKENGRFTITYNHAQDASGKDTTFTEDLTWVKDLYINEDGSVTYTRTTDVLTQKDNPLTWITGFTFADNGDVKVSFNNSSISTIEKNIQWINDVKVNDDGQGHGNQKISIKYNNANDYIDIGSPLNYVMKMALNPISGDLLALYSDPQKRQSNINYDNETGWTLLGTMNYSTTLNKNEYDAKTLNERVNNLIVGATCYCIEEI